jgi:hypothetical protein
VRGSSLQQKIIRKNSKISKKHDQNLHLPDPYIYGDTFLFEGKSMSDELTTSSPEVAPVPSRRTAGNSSKTGKNRAFSGIYLSKPVI